jgi:two-component system sensor histidine kinase RegB
MGIGLFLANATLERLGGDVVFLPREGGGVIARVILPIHSSATD